MPIPHIVASTPTITDNPVPLDGVSRQAAAMSLTRDGVTISLTPDEGFIVMPGVEGLDAVPWLLAESSPYAWDGGYVSPDPRADFRAGLIPLYLEGSSAEEIRSRKRALMRLLSPRGSSNPVTWKVTYSDGYWRSIDGWYVPDGDAQAADTAGLRWQILDVPLRCPDPFWQGPDVDVEFVVPNVSATPLISATIGLLPLYIAASTVIGDPVEVTNPGDVEAFPVWTITGPATAVTVTLDDTGEEFSLPGGVVDGEVITVDTRRGKHTVTDAAGTSQFSRLAANPDLFSLPAGDTTITVGMSGAGPNASVVLSFTPRYLTAS